MSTLMTRDTFLMEKAPLESFFSQVFSVACTPSHFRSRETFVPGFQYSFGR